MHREEVQETVKDSTDLFFVCLNRGDSICAGGRCRTYTVDSPTLSDLGPFVDSLWGFVSLLYPLSAFLSLLSLSSVLSFCFNSLFILYFHDISIFGVVCPFSLSCLPFLSYISLVSLLPSVSYGFTL